MKAMADAPRWFAIASGGAALRIGPAGLVIGRHASCDLVLDDPRVSRRHLLLQPEGTGLKATALARGGTVLNGRVLEATAEVGAADELALPDGTVVRVRANEEDGPSQPAPWGLELAPGQVVALRSAEVTVGGAWQDDVVIDGWPAAALHLTCGAKLTCVANVGGVTLDGAAAEVGASVFLAVGVQLGCRPGRAIRVVAAEPADETTIAAPVVVAPTRIVLELLPNGGRLTLHVGAQPRSAVLSERRFALAVALLAPEPPEHAGDFIEDEKLFARVWPRHAGVDRGDLNQLVHRLRGDLTGAGLDGARLIERLVKGGATRFVVDAGTKIESRG